MKVLILVLLRVNYLIFEQSIELKNIKFELYQIWKYMIFWYNPLLEGYHWKHQTINLVTMVLILLLNIALYRWDLILNSFCIYIMHQESALPKTLKKSWKKIYNWQKCLRKVCTFLDKEKVHYILQICFKIDYLILIHLLLKPQEQLQSIYYE